MRASKGSGWIPQPQSVGVWYIVAQNSYFNINQKCAPFVVKPETAIMTLGDWIGNRDEICIDKLKVDARWLDLAS